MPSITEKIGPPPADVPVARTAESPRDVSSKVCSELAAELESLRQTVASMQGELSKLLDARIEQVQASQRSLEARFALLEERQDEKISVPVAEKTPMTSQKTGFSPSTSKWCCVRAVSKGFHLLDRWGHDHREQPRPKLILGGIIFLVLFISLGVYAAILYAQYDDLEPSVSPTVKWSISAGPYPLPIKCFAQECLVSLNLGTVDAGSHGCISKVPSTQLNRCFSLKKGEEIVVDTCYSLLPTQGVHVQFIGPVAWQELEPTLHTELGNDAISYGLASVSDMLGMNEPVLKFLTPIRSGVTVLDYVKTKNDTRPEGSEGAIRREWFSLLLSSDVSQSAFDNSPCQRNQPGWQKAILTMAPQWTEIEVSPPPTWISAAIGEVGGAFEVLEILGAVVLFVVWRVIRQIECFGWDSEGEALHASAA